MNKSEYKQRMAKIRWATEKEKGKKMGKKGLVEAQGIVMQMLPQDSSKVTYSSNPTWREKKEKEPERMKVDLMNLIGKDFKKC